MDAALDRLDPQSEVLLNLLESQERLRASRVPGVRTVLVILSAQGMVFDLELLRQKILLTYPDATVFFRTTNGRPMGAGVTHPVDLLIDFTGPGQRQKWFYSRKLRRHARVAVGRNAGLFRKRIYDRVLSEATLSTSSKLQEDPLERERQIQRGVLALVGVAITQSGEALEDLESNIALGLPPLTKR